MKSIIIYHSCFTSFGGVETFCVNLAHELKKHYDITFISTRFFPLVLEFDNAEILDTTKRYDADVVIFATAWGKLPQNIHGKKVIQMVHAQYDVAIAGWQFVYQRHTYTTHHVCVGNAVKESFERATPYRDAIVIPNLLKSDAILHPKPEPSNVLRLITASRFSREKGFDRMLKLGNLLIGEGVKFVWDVYGNYNSNYGKSIMRKASSSFRFHGYKKDVSKEVATSDYLVQLSDSEGFPYATYEALQQLTPVITTDFPSAKEQVDDGINGWILDFDLSDWKKILADKLILSKFEHKSTLNDWVKILEK